MLTRKLHDPPTRDATLLLHLGEVAALAGIEPALNARIPRCCTRGIRYNSLKAAGAVIREDPRIRDHRRII